MKEITITVSDDVARWARVWAAERETSVSRLVGAVLTERMEQESAYEQHMKAFLSREPAPLKRSGSHPTREELHDR